MKNNKYGYARISRDKQNIQRQINNLEELKCDRIFQEEFTGTTIDRIEFKKLIKKVKNGDTIIFDSVSRMSRGGEEGVKIYFDLMEKGITLQFIKEPHINTESYKRATEKALQSQGIDFEAIGYDSVGNLLKSIFKAIKQFQLEKIKDDIKLAFMQAKKEVENTRKLTSDGLKRAKLEGKNVGGARNTGKKLITKKSIVMKDKIKKMDKSFNGSMRSIEVMEMLKISRNTYFKYKKMIREES